MRKQLLDFLKSLTRADRESFAQRCDTTVEYLFQIGYGRRTPKVGLVVAVERESTAKVRCEDLLPDVDWAYLRKGPPVQLELPAP